MYYLEIEDKNGVRYKTTIPIKINNDYYDPFYNTDYITRLKAQIIILKSLLLEEGDPDAK